jgi:hypothetical protein
LYRLWPENPIYFKEYYMHFKKIIAVAAFVIFAACGKSPTVLDINGEKITLKKFNNYYYSHLKNQYNVNTNSEIDKLATDQDQVRRNPLLDKNVFLDELVKQKLVFMKAKEEKVTSKKEAKALMQMQEENIVVAAFAKDKFKDKIVISDKEIADAYEAGKASFNGAPLSQVEPYIRQQLQQEKFTKEATTLVEDLKGQTPVERNKEVILALSDPDKTKRPKDGWVAKLDGTKITVDDLETLYYAQMQIIYGTSSSDDIDKFAADPKQTEQNPLLNKEKFLEEIIKQKVVYTHALKAKTADNDEVKALVEMQQESLMIGYYAKEKFAKDIEVTDAEIGDVYQKQGQYFKGVPISQAETYIKRNLQQQKLQMKIMDLIQKLKDETKVIKNRDLLDNKDSKKKEDNKEAKEEKKEEKK